jgi:hypothetical protein
MSGYVTDEELVQAAKARKEKAAAKAATKASAPSAPAEQRLSADEIAGSYGRTPAKPELNLSPVPAATPAPTPRPANAYSASPSSIPSSPSPSSTPASGPALNLNYVAPPTSKGPAPAAASKAASAPKPPSAKEAGIAKLVGSGGRISSRDMRRFELEEKQRRKDKKTAEKRSEIMSQIPKTRTKDSEGGSLGFDRSWQKGADGKWAANPDSKPLTPEEEQSWQETRTLGHAPSADAPLPSKARVAKYKDEEKKVGWRMMIGADSKEEAIKGRAERLNKAALDKARANGRGASSVKLMPTSGEEATREWESVEASDRVTTQYDTSPEAREQSRLKMSPTWAPEPGAEGPSGPSNKAQLTHQYGTKVDGAGNQHAGFVVNPQSGDVHTFREDFFTGSAAAGNQKNQHHTTPLAGGNVSGAGNMTINPQGHITDIGDQSGHYRPEAEYTHTGVAEMHRRGMLQRPADAEDQAEAGPGMTSANVTLGGFAKDDPRMAKGWLEHEEGIYKGNLTLKPQQFLQTSGNERQARAKHELNEELEAGQGALKPKAEQPTVGAQAGIRKEIEAQRAREAANHETKAERKARGKQWRKETKAARKAAAAPAAAPPVAQPAPQQAASPDRPASTYSHTPSQASGGGHEPVYVNNPTLSPQRPANAYGHTPADSGGGAHEPVYVDNPEISAPPRPAHAYGHTPADADADAGSDGPGPESESEETDDEAPNYVDLTLPKR